MSGREPLGDDVLVVRGIPLAGTYEALRVPRTENDVEIRLELPVAPERFVDDAVLFVDPGELAVGDRIVVRTIDSVSQDSAQAVYELETGEEGQFEAALSSKQRLFALEPDGQLRAVAPNSAWLSADGELRIDRGAGGGQEFVSSVEGAHESRLTTWTLSDAAAVPEVALDIRSYRSTDVAYDVIDTAPTVSDKTIVVVPNERVVGVAVEHETERFVVAVTKFAGDFEKCESQHDAERTLDLGVEPAVFHEAVSMASADGYPLDTRLANAVMLLESFRREHAAELDRSFIAETSDVERVVSDYRDAFGRVGERPVNDVGNGLARSVSAGWNYDRETFVAVVSETGDGQQLVGRPDLYGQRHAEFITVDALLAALDEGGTPLRDEDVVELRATEAALDGPRIVGVVTNEGPQLAIVTEAEQVSRLDGPVEHSPDGPNWGYAGNGPREATLIIATATVGATGATPEAQERLLHGVVARLPTEFSMPAKDVSAFLADGSPPSISTAGSEFAAARTGLAGSSTIQLEDSLDLRASRTVEVGDLSL